MILLELLGVALVLAACFLSPPIALLVLGLLLAGLANRRK